MKPRNKFEKAVLAQSKSLRPITKRQMDWAFRECIDHYAYRLPKGRTTCMDYGHGWLMAEPSDSCTCPKCGARLKVRQTFERKLPQKQYFTVLTTSGEYQVLRKFLLVVEMEKGCKAKPYSLEIGQYWWNAQGRMAVVGIQRVLGRYIDTFSFGSPLAVRSDNAAYRHIAYSPIYPKSKVLDVLRRNGFDGDFHDIVPTRLIPALLSDSRAETLMKAGQYPMLHHYLTSRFDMERYWASVKICLRNGCPSDLKSEHDKLVARRNRQRERERTEQQRMKAIEDEKNYLKTKGMFFGLAFSDNLILVKVIESVEEMETEGRLMHHCVGGYHNRKNSLILSARIDGRRIETVEVSLKTFEVVQCRGVCNENTEYHDRIIALVNSNMSLIRQRMNAA